MKPVERQLVLVARKMGFGLSVTVSDFPAFSVRTAPFRFPCRIALLSKRRSSAASISRDRASGGGRCSIYGDRVSG